MLLTYFLFFGIMYISKERRIKEMTSHAIRENLGNWTQEEFASYFGIPVGTVKNWDARNCMPAYIENMVDELILWKKRALFNKKCLDEMLEM